LELNAMSVTTCNEPSCSALANVSLVVGVTAAERIPWLLDYSLWFANLQFVLSSFTVNSILQTVLDTNLLVIPVNHHLVG
jgi:hypothetical protein